MNKNTIIGVVIIAVILVGFSWYNNSQYEKQVAAKKIEQAFQDSVQKAWLAANPQAVDTARTVNPTAQDSAVTTESVAKFGAFPAGVSEELTTLENNVMKITFSNKGGRVASVELKDYKRLYDKFNGDPLVLFFPENSKFGLEFYTPEKVYTNDCYFSIGRKDDNTISYRLYSDSTSYLEYLYTLSPDDYMLDFSVDLANFGNTIVTNQSDLTLSWSVVSPQEEKGFKNENNYTTVAYKFPAETNIEELPISTQSETQTLTTKVHWVAFKQQFFSSILIAKDNFAGATVGYDSYAPEDANIKKFQALFLLPFTPQTKSYDFNFYFGPNKYSTLNAYGDNLELQKLVPLGWGIIGWVNMWLVIPVFDFLGGFFTNYGLIILFLTIFIKILISPLTFKSYMSSAKMRLLKPELEALNKKFPKKEDAMKKQQATMGLYKSAGVNPMGGCLPMLIQFPFLIAMFKFFPASIELRGQSFLWSDDLSSYDSIWIFPDGFAIPFYGDHISLFTLLMAVSLYFTSKINMSQQPTAGSQQMPGMKFMMLYMMPVMLLFFFNDSAAGLSYYYLLSNIITLILMYAFRFLVNDDKLHARMKATAAKPKKQSKWAARLEQMQKQAEAQQRARGK